MAVKTVGLDKDIKITDKIRFVLETKDADGCLIDPYKINQITIYYAARDFTSTSVFEYQKETSNEILEKKYNILKKTYCENPTESVLNEINRLKVEIQESKTIFPFHFKNAVPIKNFGGEVDQLTGEIFPAWLNIEYLGDVGEELYEKISKENYLIKDSTGRFILEWNPVGCREGDYFICWNWNPNLVGNAINGHETFILLGDSSLTNAIPIHYTKKNKYEILLEKYLPDMFKNFISEGDLTPYVLQELNLSIAKGFTFIEDLANQIIDLLDSNSIHEQLLPLLSNLFNLKLKSNDPILWRRQIKKAVQNFKKKGTVRGLKSALSDSGINFLGVDKLWQLRSKYTCQEHYDYKGSNNFKLSKNIILNYDHFEVWFRRNNWVKVENESVEIVDNELRWVSDLIKLQKGDSVRVLYQYEEIPSESEESLENYIRSLDLMDKRDERDQSYPIKDWNTRLIEESDPLFDILIPIKHQLSNPVIWGKIRTEFPYSENAYNMDEYNGSTRDSLNPCDIDKEFIDSCSHCQSSKLNINIEIEELSNDKLYEAKQVIEEFVPFHSLINSINYLGSFNEFMKPPIETISSMINISKEEVIISGDAQKIFNRSLPREFKAAVSLKGIAEQYPPSNDPSNGDLYIVDNTDTFPEGTNIGDGFLWEWDSWRKINQDENGELLLKEGDFIYSGFKSIKRDLLATFEELENASPGSGSVYNMEIRLFCPGSSSVSDLKNDNKLHELISKNINTSYTLSENFLENSNILEVVSNGQNKNFYTISKNFKNSFTVVGDLVENPSLDRSQFEFRVSNKIYDQSSGVSLEVKNILKFKDLKFNFSDLNIPSEKTSNNAYFFKIEETNYSIKEILPNYEFILDGNLNESISNFDWQLLDENLNIIASGESGNLNILKMGLVDFNNTLFDINKIKLGDYILYLDDSNNIKQHKIKSFINDETDKFYVEYEGNSFSGRHMYIYRRIAENCVGQFDYYGIKLITDINYASTDPDDDGINNGLKTNLQEKYLILIDSDYYSIVEIDNNDIILDGPNKDFKLSGTSKEFVMYKFTNQPQFIDNNKESFSFSEIKRSDNEIIGKINLDYNTGELSALASKLLNGKDQISDTTKFEENIEFNIEYKELE